MPTNRWFLVSASRFCAAANDQTYYQYLGHVLGKSSEMPDLLHCKLADRLDNTMDIAVQRPPTDQHDFFETAFGVLFLPNYQMRPRTLTVHLTARPACCSFRSYSRMWFS